MLTIHQLRICPKTKIPQNCQVVRNRKGRLRSKSGVSWVWWGSLPLPLPFLEADIERLTLISWSSGDLMSLTVGTGKDPGLYGLSAIVVRDREIVRGIGAAVRLAWESCACAWVDLVPWDGSVVYMRDYFLIIGRSNFFRPARDRQWRCMELLIYPSSNNHAWGSEANWKLQFGHKQMAKLCL